MPTYTMEVFRWSGTGYNAQYDTSYTATFDDNDDSVGGSSDSDETVSINGGAAGATNGSPYKIAISFTDTDGNSHVEDFNFFHTSDGGWHFAAEPGSAFTTGATLGSYQSHSVGWDYDEVVCFASGTKIQTSLGEVSVEHLVSGDLVKTSDASFKPLAMNLCRSVSAKLLRENEKLRPVRITTGALGNGLPTRDLLVSRQHRMLVSSKISQRMFGEKETLIAAIRLTALPGIFVDNDIANIDYHHLLFDTHEVIFAEGAPSESLYSGAEALQTLAPEARAEILQLFPEFTKMQTKGNAARLIPSAKDQKRLVDRHATNAQPLLHST
ncbi:hypothetical protein NBRC116601_03500 [Cognatishimia sp. WU-CL00825]|uniref:Hint domain-containing protein n=1 Tax=Cognatishimia sp. WU-CL00825 TaxID=3127658 RepID=UPI003105DB1E